MIGPPLRLVIRLQSDLLKKALREVDEAGRRPRLHWGRDEQKDCTD